MAASAMVRIRFAFYLLFYWLNTARKMLDSEVTVCGGVRQVFT